MTRNLLKTLVIVDSMAVATTADAQWTKKADASWLSSGNLYVGLVAITIKLIFFLSYLYTTQSPIHGQLHCRFTITDVVIAKSLIFKRASAHRNKSKF